MVSEVRLDKYLWSIRFYKTRSQATEACKKGRITIDDVTAKPSRVIKPGEIIHARKQPITYVIRAITLIDKRVSAKIAKECYEDITPTEEMEKLETKKHQQTIFYDKGGRPTKKDRRLMDRFRKQKGL